jgi:two-component system phosphate regulon sensor histidine kinase PhoR
VHLRAPSVAWTTAGIIDRARVPRAPQLAFLVPVVVLELLLAVLSPAQIATPPFLLGMGTVLVATLVTLTAPWDRLPAWTMMTVPLLDLVGLRILHQVPNADAVAGLVVVPAMWIGAMYGARGVVLVTSASLFAFLVPSVFASETTTQVWSHAVLIPMVAFLAAVSMGVTAEVWRAQRRSLVEQGNALGAALEEFRSQRALTDAIVNVVDVGLLALGPDGNYKSMNPRQSEFIRLANPDGHDTKAGEADCCAYDADNQAVLAYDDMPTVRAMKGETFTDQTVWVGRDPADRLALSVSGWSMRDDDGNIDGAVLAYKDVTDLMRALRVRDDFVASVSHELRTPLTSIMGYLDMAIEHNAELAPEVAHYLRVASRNADRLLLLVSDLLTAAQGEGHAMRISPHPTDLAALVHLCLDDATPRAEVAGLHLERDIADLPKVVADAGRLAQVVDNLVSNAVKYTPPGGTVSLTLASSEAQVVITVRDSGIGIATDDQKDLFTKFFRAPNATERAIPGIGLGLVITKAIVEAHGGSIEFESEEGVGTTVRVSVPFVPTEPPVPDDKQPFSLAAPVE